MRGPVARDAAGPAARGAGALWRCHARPLRSEKRGGGLFRSTDAGKRWKALPKTAAGPGSSVLADETGMLVLELALSPLDSNTLFAGTYAGAFKSTDGGEMWSQPSDTVTGPFRALVFDPSKADPRAAESAGHPPSEGRAGHRPLPRFGRPAEFVEDGRIGEPGRRGPQPRRGEGSPRRRDPEGGGDSSSREDLGRGDPALLGRQRLPELRSGRRAVTSGSLPEVLTPIAGGLVVRE